MSSAKPNPAGVSASIVYGSSSPFLRQYAVERAVVDWVDALGSQLRRSTAAEALTLDGVDLIDVLFLPFYLQGLAMLRDGVPRQRSAPRLAARFRAAAYRLKVRAAERRAARHSAALATADVVLWSRDVTHTVQMAPVAMAMRELGVASQLVACNPKAFGTLIERDANSVYLPSAWPEVTRAARREGLRRATACQRGMPEKLPRLSGVAPQRVAAVVRETLFALLPLATEAVVNAQQIIARQRPKVLVVGNDLSLEGRAGCRVAALHQLPTAMIMHGSIAPEPIQSRHCADRLLLFGDNQRVHLDRLGLPADRMRVCGAPFLDARRQPSNTTHSALQQQLGLAAQEPWILVATSGAGHRVSLAHHRRMIELFGVLSKMNPSVPVVIKLHNKDSLENYRDIIAASGASRLKVVPRGQPGVPSDIFDWLHGCSMLITCGSTAAVDAMLMDVPVITVDLNHEAEDVDYIAAGATIHARSGEELQQAVSDVMAGCRPADAEKQHARQFLETMFFAPDGRAAARAASEIVALMSSPTTPQ